MWRPPWWRESRRTGAHVLIFLVAGTVGERILAESLGLPIRADTGSVLVDFLAAVGVRVVVGLVVGEPFQVLYDAWRAENQ